MHRLTCLLIVASLGVSLSGYADEKAQAPASPGAAGQLISFGHDPNCPGCRAFLAGYGGGGEGCAHSPSCSACDGGGGIGAGDGLGPATADELALGEELFTGSLGTGYGYLSAAPGMIGDFFGGSYQMLMGSAGQGVVSPDNYGAVADPNARSNVSIGGGDRRFKIAENYSPFPTNRIFYNYNRFQDALRTADGRPANLNRSIFGAETTFWDGLWSAEIRLPLSSGLNSDQTLTTTANNVNTQFGNIAFALKRLMFRTETLAASAGLGLVVPTAADTNLFDAGGTLRLTVHNDAFYLQPFMGLWWTPNERFFSQSSLQVDIDARGNNIDMLDSVGTFRQVGVLQDQTLLFLDTSIGYWLFRNPNGGGLITGIAPMLELHYSTTMDAPDIVDLSQVDVGATPGNSSVQNFNGGMDVLNLTGAVRTEIAGRSYLTIFGVAPLRDGTDRVFNYELGAQYTRLF